MAATAPGPLDEADFREVMAAVCTPVTVVTTLDGDRPHGTTVSAFGSLSLRPPMVTVALDRDSDLLALVRRTRRIGVNVLSHGQEELALAFARKGGDKFDGVAWGVDHDLPRIDGVGGWLACDVAEIVPGGDHSIVLGGVVAAHAQSEPPLVYQRRLFGTHSAFLVAPGE
ncbi:MAG: flavin reductase family protein [Solirubrobacterales bacterium]|nr:flavin reductase family protein [Solirubrobacterales bacterium]